MKLILSRKGFDSGAGGVPSPIFPDGKMVSLPIPDRTSVVRYQDIQFDGEISVGEIVETLTRGRIRRDDTAHLDPDLRRDSLPRSPCWRPIFGQTGAARGHVRNQGIGPGDLFLFFGLFREVTWAEGALRYTVDRMPQHAVFGWLQIERILAVDSPACQALAWARYHPHLNRKPNRNNTIYLASDELVLQGRRRLGLPGCGAFPLYSEELRLTAPGSEKVSLWRLPQWFHPSGRRSALTYHSDPFAWQRQGDAVLLRTVGRGQEFVLDCDDYPEAVGWVAGLLPGSRNEHS